MTDQWGRSSNIPIREESMQFRCYVTKCGVARNVTV